jgi:hypothetical protein
VSEWLKETGCKPVGSAYAGSNPAPTTIVVVESLPLEATRTSTAVARSALRAARV